MYTFGYELHFLKEYLTERQDRNPDFIGALLKIQDLEITRQDIKKQDKQMEELAIKVAQLEDKTKSLTEALERCQLMAIAAQSSSDQCRSDVKVLTHKLEETNARNDKDILLLQEADDFVRKELGQHESKIETCLAQGEDMFKDLYFSLTNKHN